MRVPNENLYAVLGVQSNSTFIVLKKAYYKRAKECHPDRFQGDPVKEDEFKRLVNAFDILSDPQRRDRYNEYLSINQQQGNPEVTLDERALYPKGRRSVMDTLADDVLEEMIVGNDIPANATLQTLMRDLENTTRFLRFREAKNYYYHKQFGKAAALLKKSVAASPENILYHYYYAQCSVGLKRYGQARKHFNICLKLGARRVPPQRLERVRRRLSRLHERQGIVGKVFSLFLPPAPSDSRSSDEQMIDEMSQSMTRYMSENNRRELGTDKTKYLGQ
jgi:tetratricopeptide (TPR) repeat protein